MEIHVGRGAFDTLRIRFDDGRIGPALAGIAFDDATLSACFDMHAPSIEEAMLRLAAEVEHPAPDSPMVAEAIVTLLLLDLRRFLQEATQRASRRRGGLSARALRLALAMIDAPDVAPSLDAMAQRCGLSRDHFIRCFHQSTGISPGAAIRRRRMERAKAMLVEDHGSIEDIARSLGYAGAPSFCAAFRRETGRPPGAWRALMR
jgi:AraC-like DNA-binding protein